MPHKSFEVGLKRSCMCSLLQLQRIVYARKRYMKRDRIVTSADIEVEKRNDGLDWLKITKQEE